MSVFRFKQFSVKQERSAMKVGTDAMLLGSLLQAHNPSGILDVGTGTGVVSLMLAQRFRDAQISGIEIDEDAALEALENFENSPWKHRLSLIHADFLQHPFEQHFDVIVSNPPYYQSRLENEDPKKALARHESALPMKYMLNKVKKLLTDTGSFWVIVPADIGEMWVNTAEDVGFQCIGRKDIYGKKGSAVKRVVLEFGMSALDIDPQELIHTAKDDVTVRNSDGPYTDQYIELTKAFHFNDLRG